eukprot:UN32111
MLNVLWGIFILTMLDPNTYMPLPITTCKTVFIFIFSASGISITVVGIFVYFKQLSLRVILWTSDGVSDINTVVIKSIAKLGIFLIPWIALFTWRTWDLLENRWWAMEEKCLKSQFKSHLVARIVAVAWTLFQVMVLYLY